MSNQQPTFEAAAISAYAAMSTNESENDFLVCGFKDGSNEMQLIESGKGGRARVVAILEEQFQSGIAVAVFRVTAVDDLENNRSIRAKIVHVIYVGKGTPVLKRARATTHNAALKRPFIHGLAIQTDDVADVSEEELERALNAATGAHRPNSYDFINNTRAGPAHRNDAAAIKAAQMAEKAQEAEAAAAIAAAAEAEQALVQEQQEEETPAPVQEEEAAPMQEEEAPVQEQEEAAAVQEEEEAAPVQEEEQQPAQEIAVAE